MMKFTSTIHTKCTKCKQKSKYDSINPPPPKQRYSGWFLVTKSAAYTGHIKFDTIIDRW